MKEGSGNGAFLCEGFDEGNWREGFFTGETEVYV